MSGSGAWARNDLDDMVAAPPRPASLSISNSTSTNTASTVKVWVYKSQILCDKKYLAEPSASKATTIIVHESLLTS